MHLKKILKNLMTEKDLKSQDMARDLGISPALMSSIVYGRRKMTQEMLENIIIAYDVNGDQRDQLIISFLKSMSWIADIKITFFREGIIQEYRGYILARVAQKRKSTCAEDL